VWRSVYMRVVLCLRRPLGLRLYIPRTGPIHNSLCFPAAAAGLRCRQTTLIAGTSKWRKVSQCSSSSDRRSTSPTLNEARWWALRANDRKPVTTYDCLKEPPRQVASLRSEFPLQPTAVERTLPVLVRDAQYPKISDDFYLCQLRRVCCMLYAVFLFYLFVSDFT